MYLFYLALCLFFFYRRTHTIISKLDVVTTSKGNGFDVRSFAKQEKLDIYDWPVTKVHLNGKYDIGVVVSFGRLISEKIINHFPLYVYNIISKHCTFINCSSEIYIFHKYSRN